MATLAAEVSLAVLAKLGSIAVHADELLSEHGHDADRIAIKSLLSDPDIVSILSRLESMAMVPVKRNKT